MDLRLLALTLEAQKHFSKSFRNGDSESIAGKFIVHDMLDMLGKQLDEDRLKREEVENDCR